MLTACSGYNLRSSIFNVQCLSNRYTMVFPSVRRDNLRALASGLSPIHADNRSGGHTKV